MVVRGNNPLPTKTELFDAWNEQAKIIDAKTRQKVFKEREIWWYYAGENIGHEINGKGLLFLRPILIVRKYGSKSFFGVPLSSQEHRGRWFAEVSVRDKVASALLSQSGSFSVNRLRGKISRIHLAEFDELCKKLQELLFNLSSK